MNRRNVLKLLAALPFLGWLKPNPKPPATGGTDFDWWGHGVVPMPGIPSRADPVMEVEFDTKTVDGGTVRIKETVDKVANGHCVKFCKAGKEWWLHAVEWYGFGEDGTQDYHTARELAGKRFAAAEGIVWPFEIVGAPTLTSYDSLRSIDDAELGQRFLDCVDVD